MSVSKGYEGKKLSIKNLIIICSIVSLLLFMTSHLLYPLYYNKILSGSTPNVNFFGVSVNLITIIDLCLFLAIGLIIFVVLLAANSDLKRGKRK